MKNKYITETELKEIINEIEPERVIIADEKARCVLSYNILHNKLIFYKDGNDSISEVYSFEGIKKIVKLYNSEIKKYYIKRKS